MTPAETLSALRTLTSSCETCAKLYVKLNWALRDRRDVARKAARDTTGRKDWPERLAKTRDHLEEQLARVAEHLDQPHDQPSLDAPQAPLRLAPKADDRPACPTCGTKVSVKDGRIRAHKARSGTACPRRFFEVDLSAVVRDLPTSLPSGSDGMKPTGSCHDCGQWLPGERRLCGQCARKRDSRARTG